MWGVMSFLEIPCGAQHPADLEKGVPLQIEGRGKCGQETQEKWTM